MIYEDIKNDNVLECIIRGYEIIALRHSTWINMNT